MALITNTPELLSADLESLVTAAIGGGVDGLSKMLECIAKKLGAFGCALWETAPITSSSGTRSTVHLFINSAWFPTRRIFACHDLPLTDSFTGDVILHQKARTSSDIQREGKAGRRHSFLLEHKISRMCSVPLSFLDGHRGAVNVYRKTGDPPFESGEQVLLEKLAAFIPPLYQSLRDKVNFGVLSRVNEILQKAEERAGTSRLLVAAQEGVLQDICDEIAETFHYLEVSVFLQDRNARTGQFRLMATTWPSAKEFKKSYFARADEGITGWVLQHNRTVRVFDLAHFERDSRTIQEEYPGLVWRDSLEMTSNAREFLPIDPGDDLPPLSFMAAPLAFGDRVLGVLRCCLSKFGPYYFSDRDLQFLRLLAGQISLWWSSGLRRHEMEEENQTWQTFVQRMTELNSLVQMELSRQDPSEKRIYQEALSLARSVIGGSDILAVRLLDDLRGDLYFAETLGEAWDLGTHEAIQKRRSYRFPVDKKLPQSTGAKAVRDAKLVVVPDVNRDPHALSLFPQVRGEICSPIMIHSKVFGVLDIEWTQERSFPKYTETVAELLGNQLGLYHHLVVSIGELRHTQEILKQKLDELEKLQREQNRTFEGLSHQLKGPLAQVQRRAEFAALADSGAERDRINVLAIRGLARKARRVGMSIGLLADLSRAKPIQIKGGVLDVDRLLKMLIEAAQDTELSIHPRRSISFSVVKESFQVARACRIKADFDMLEQAINNLFDNAAKYSFSDTEVIITGQLLPTRAFRIVVANEGLPIRAEEVDKCKEREWRGRQARLTTEEGSGIGLWLVDNIMKAQAGELVITPTKSDRVTEVALEFAL